MPATIYLITGGCRSGKSSYAQSLCEQLCPNNPIYLATSAKHLWDDDFSKRIQRHQSERGPAWTTVEEAVHPSKHAAKFKGRAVMVDCLTLWLTNFMVQEGAFTPDSVVNKDADDTTTTVVAKEANESSSSNDTSSTPEDRALAAIKQEFDTLVQQWDATFFFVTNEIGSGTHATDHFTRKFVDAQGWLNQHVAAAADRVIHMVSGIPNVIKDFAPADAVVPAAATKPTEHAIATAIMLDKVLSTRGLQMDAKGYFMMKLQDGLIVATFHSCILNDKGEVCDLEGVKIPCCGNSNRPQAMKTWKCRTAKELTAEIFERWALSKDVVTPAHAAYIGREAQRADHCLYAGKQYQQD